MSKRSHSNRIAAVMLHRAPIAHETSCRHVEYRYDAVAPVASRALAEHLPTVAG